MSVVKCLAELDIQKRMAIKRNGCTVKGEGENVSAPIGYLKIIKRCSNVNMQNIQLVPLNSIIIVVVLIIS
jgi:hypothetical protein